MTASPSVRRAVIEDLDALQDVYRLASLSNEHDRPNLLAHPELLDLDPAGVREARTLAAVDRGTVVGFATFALRAEHLELEALFVEPDHRRRGHAMRLVEAVVETARRAGVTRVEVTANDHASAFYDAAGFVEVGRVETRFGPAPRKHLAVHLRQSVPVPITARAVDPRDQTWEEWDPAYRVYFWDARAACEEWELTGRDASEALTWAQDSADGRTFTLYAVVNAPSGLGLVRLAGTDPTRT